MTSGIVHTISSLKVAVMLTYQIMELANSLALGTGLSGM